MTEGSADEHTLFCWSGVHGLASLVVERQLNELELRDKSIETLAEIMLSRMFNGIAARPS